MIRLEKFYDLISRNATVTLTNRQLDTTFFEGRIPPEKRGDFMQAEDIAEVMEFIITRRSNINFHDISFDSFAFFKR